MQFLPRHVNAAPHAVIGLGSSVTWALFGAGLSRLFANPRTVHAFNVATALLLAASLYPIVVAAW